MASPRRRTPGEGSTSLVICFVMKLLGEGLVKLGPVHMRQQETDSRGELNVKGHQEGTGLKFGWEDWDR